MRPRSTEAASSAASKLSLKRSNFPGLSGTAVAISSAADEFSAQRAPDDLEIAALADAKATLFVPRHGAEYEIWAGRAPTCAEFRARYGVEDVRFVDELAAWLVEARS